MNNTILELSNKYQNISIYPPWLALPFWQFIIKFLHLIQADTLRRIANNFWIAWRHGLAGIVVVIEVPEPGKSAQKGRANQGG